MQKQTSDPPPNKLTLLDSDDDLEDLPCKKESEFNLAEPLAGSDESDEDRYSVDFEDEPEKVIQGKSSFETFSLGNNITLKAPIQFKEKVRILKSEAWDVSERNSEISTIGLKENDKFCTDIFHIIDDDQNDENERDQIDIPEEYINDVTFSVTVKKKESDPFYSFFVLIKTEGRWIRKEASKTENILTFHASTISNFCVICTPFYKEDVIYPEGGKYVDENDNDMQIMFPGGCVEEPQNIKFTVYPPDNERIRWGQEHSPNQYTITALTACLYVDYGKAFQTPVQVQLATKSLENHEGEMFYFRLSDDKAEIINPSMDTIQVKEHGTLAVSGFSGYGGGLVRHGSINSLTSSEVSLALGIHVNCTILFYMTKDAYRYLQLWIELVKEDIEKEIMKEREEMGMQEMIWCRSSDIKLRQNERVRIDVGGNIEHTTKRLDTFITFHQESRKNYLKFPVVITEQMGGAPYAIIRCFSDRGGKSLLHQADFNPFVGPRKQTPTSRHCPVRQEHTKSNMNLTCTPSYDRENARADTLHSPRSDQNKNFVSEKNMLKLTTRLSLDEAYMLSIGLGWKTTEVAKTRSSSMTTAMAHLQMIWQPLVKIHPSKRLDALKNALEEAELTHLADIVVKAYKEGRQLNVSDFASNGI